MKPIPWIDIGIIQGTTFLRSITVYDESENNPDTPISLQDATLRIEVYPLLSDPIITKALEITSTLSGQGTLTLTPTDYAQLTPGAIYIYSIILEDGQHEKSVITEGGFSIITH